MISVLCVVTGLEFVSGAECRTAMKRIVSSTNFVGFVRPDPRSLNGVTNFLNRRWRLSSQNDPSLPQILTQMREEISSDPDLLESFVASIDGQSIKSRSSRPPGNSVPYQILISENDDANPQALASSYAFASGRHTMYIGNQVPVTQVQRFLAELIVWITYNDFVLVFEEIEASQIRFLKAVLGALRSGRLPTQSGTSALIPAKTRFVFVLSNKSVRLASGRSGRRSGRVRLNVLSLDAEKESLVRELISGARSIHVVPKVSFRAPLKAARVSGGVTGLSARPDRADDWALAAGAAALGLMVGPLAWHRACIISSHSFCYCMGSRLDAFGMW